ncbi:MAG: MATE family efflux transporter, partial [Agathobacter sp.]
MNEIISRTENQLGVMPVGKLVFKYALPGTIALVVNALYNIIDQIFVGRGVGYLGNGATNVVFPMMIFTIAIGSMIGDGCAAYFSLEQGKGNGEDASKGVCNATVLTIACGILMMMVSLIFMEPLCCLFGATDNILPYAIDYGRIIAIGFSFGTINIGLGAFVRADGSPKYAMAGLFLGCIINLICDPIFIFVLDWGIKGAAFATILGMLANSIMMLVYLKHCKTAVIRKEYFILDIKICKRFLSLGISSFINQMSCVIVITVSNKLLVAYGALSKYGADIPISVMGITMKVNSIVNNIVQGISTGTQPILGYNYGAGKMERVKKTYKIAVLCCTITVVIAFLIFQLAPMKVVSLFGSQSELYNEFAVLCLTIWLLACPANGFQTCTGFFFQSVGKPLLSTI